MDLGKHLAKATEAVKRRNYAFAVNLYGQLLALQPDNAEAREGLREALFKKAEARPPNRVLARILGGVHLVVAAVARLLGKPAAAARAYERYLAMDPLDEAANLGLGQALERAGYSNSALAVYRAYARVQPRCGVAAREAGRLLYEQGRMDEALEMYEQALRVDPRDQEALKARKNLAAEGALRKSGLETARHSRELIRDKDEQRRLEKSARLQLSEEEIEAELAELERGLADRPDDVKALVRAAELHRMRNDLQSALDALERAVELDPSRSDLADRAGDLRLRLQEARVREIRETGEEARAEQAERVLAEMRAAEYRRRVEHRPTDLGLRYELGMALLDLGQVEDAIAELQQAVKDPRRKVDAWAALGRAFCEKGLFDLALGQFHKAYDAAGAGDRRAKEILYEMGSITERLGRHDEALAHFSKILEQDIGFRDVARKVEQLRAASG